jgi:uncharacterized protein YndB with AHSA1/START domain
VKVEQNSAATIDVSGDRATVTFERIYPHARHVVWRALTDPGHVSAWLDNATIDLRVGGRFDISFDDGEMHGVIDELEPERVLAYSWHDGRDDVSHVRWELSDLDAGTRMTLVHRRLAREAAPGFAAGWHHHLERMAAVLCDEEAPWRNERFQELLNEYQATRT